MRLLVVQDAPKMSSLLRRAFTEDGYAVDVEARGHEAVRMASSGSSVQVLPAACFSRLHSSSMS
jgi:DNA-binding response OmpR family regulator